MILKAKPEDFIVTEIADLDMDGGPYSYYLLQKKEMNTVDACLKAAKLLGSKPKHVNFAGAKDKHAVTSQHISVFLGPKKDIAAGNLTLKYLGSGTARLNLGCLIGNRFEIVVRDIDSRPAPISEFHNLFDEQRFGITGENHLIGKMLLLKDFAGAAKSIAETHAEVKAGLVQMPSDYVGALKRLPKKILQMYVHSYQSYLWNRIAADADGELGLPGLDMPEEDEALYKNIMETEGISKRDFIIRQLPEISATTQKRRIMAAIHELSISELEEDERNAGKKKLTIRFWLDKGCYATLAVKAIFGIKNP